jgi:hypothetical protein
MTAPGEARILTVDEAAVRADLEKWRRVVRDSGAKFE